jgi:hypothetical protein
MVNWTSESVTNPNISVVSEIARVLRSLVVLWHSRPEAVCSIDRDLIWQIYRRPNQGCGKGRRQHHPTRAWIDKVKTGRLNLSSERIALMKMIVDDSGTFFVNSSLTLCKLDSKDYS